MKKNSVLAIIAMAILATTVAVVSCKKEKQEQTTNNDLVTSQLSEMDRKMLAFGERLKSAEESGEVMPLKEAVKTLSDYQNFLLCDASFNSPDMIRDTFDVMLPVSNGMVQLRDLKQMLEVNKANILACFDELDGVGKTIFCITSKIVEEGSTEQSTRVQTIVVMHNGPSRDNPAYAVLFDSTDYWYDFDTIGHCGDSAGLFYGQDAITKLEYKLKEWLPAPACANSRIYLSNYDEVSVLAIAYPDATSPNGYYAMPYNPDVRHHMCVTPSDMLWYYNSIKSIYSEVERADNLGRKVIDLRLNEASGGEYVRLSVLNLDMYKVNCSGVEEGGGH